MKRIGVGHVDIRPEDRARVQEVLDSGWLSPGPKVREFEEVFAKANGFRHGLFVSSGTAALQVALAAAKELYGWPDGARVFVPALTFVATVNAVLQARLDPVLVDIEPEYYEMNPLRLREASLFHRDAVALVPVHVFGLPVDYEGILAAIQGTNLRIIEDACETAFVLDHPLRAELQARVAAACFSTYACHIVTTGVGGFALTDRAEMNSLMWSLANHGRSGDRNSPPARRFHFERMGYSYRGTEFEAALGIGQVERRGEILADRAYVAGRLTQGLLGLPLALPLVRPGYRSAWMMYPVLTLHGRDRDALEDYLEQAGIETRRMLPLTNQPYLKRLKGAYIEDAFPVAGRVNQCGLYVGCHPGMDDSDIERVIDAFHAFFTGERKGD